MLHITDLDPASVVGNTFLVDTDATEKADISVKGDTGFAAFRKAATAKKRTKAPPNDETGAEIARSLAVGMRVKTKSGFLGTIRYIGRIASLPAGFWVGVELDTPSGRNNGEVEGIRIFECADNYGAVMRPENVTIFFEGGEDEL